MRIQSVTIAALLVMACSVRADPPRQVQIILESERGPEGQYFVGEPLVLKFGIKNISDKPVKISVGGDYRGGTRAHRFIITAVDDHGVKALDPDPVQGMFGGLGTSSDIAPGATVWMPITPLRYCLIDHAGSYTFRVGHDLGLQGNQWGAPEGTIKPEDLPTGEITLKFTTPDAAQAEKIVDDLITMKDTGWSMISPTRPKGDLRRDFATLRLPVYLKPLRKHADLGRAEALEGIGSIETPEATQALIDFLKSPMPALVEQAVREISPRLPAGDSQSSFIAWRQQDKTGRYAALQKASWRPELAPGLRAFAVEQIGMITKATVGGEVATPSADQAAQFLEAIGEKGDAPAVFAALDAALLRNEPLAPNYQFLTDPKYAQSLFAAARALLARGAAAPQRDRLSAIALELQKIDGRLWNSPATSQPAVPYRPPGWQAMVVARIANPQPYLRQLALQTLFDIPEPAPAEVAAGLPDLMNDMDVYVRMAAIQLAGKAGGKAVSDALLEILRASKDDGILYYGGLAARQLNLGIDWLDICAARLAEPGRWSAFCLPLVGTLDGLTGSGGWGTPTQQEARQAQQLWLDFVALHRDEIAAGRKIPLDQANPTMVPTMNLTRTGGGTWPERPARGN